MRFDPGGEAEVGLVPVGGDRVALAGAPRPVRARPAHGPPADRGWSDGPGGAR
ncbi:hypothetical protein I3F58_10830, partial [Streptomyces sp. MUM 203J]|nr:hypothetical protein [Streptomyces sp. MUM 203J]